MTRWPSALLKERVFRLWSVTFQTLSALKETAMSQQSDPSRISGAFTQATGKLKEGVGAVFGSDEMKQSGVQKQQQGQREIDAAKARTTAQGWKNDAEGKNKQQQTFATGNDKLNAEGKIQECSGRAQQNL